LALGYLDNKTGLKMTSVSGNLSTKATIGETRSSFTRPGSAAVITTFDGLNVLDKLPLAREEAPEDFDYSPEIIDNQTGVYEQFMSWLHPFIDGMRQFAIKRMQVPAEMDYWRDFCNFARGMREPFLFPTYREDILLATNPTSSSTTLDVLTEDYDDIYFPYDTYKRLRLVAPNGEVIYRKVQSVLVLSPTTQRLTLTAALPGTAQWGSGFKIGYLNKVRLASDQVRLDHYKTYSIINLSIRTTDT